MSNQGGVMMTAEQIKSIGQELIQEHLVKYPDARFKTEVIGNEETVYNVSLSDVENHVVLMDSDAYILVGDGYEGDDKTLYDEIIGDINERSICG